MSQNTAATQATQAQQQPTLEQLKARIAELEAKISTKQQGTITFKVSAKGAVSAYGLGRYPATLYSGQWLRLLDKADELRKFIADNAGKLAVKE